MQQNRREIVDDFGNCCRQQEIVNMPDKRMKVTSSCRSIVLYCCSICIVCAAKAKAKSRTASLAVRTPRVTGAYCLPIYIATPLSQHCHPTLLAFRLVTTVVCVIR